MDCFVKLRNEKLLATIVIHGIHIVSKTMVRFKSKFKKKFKTVSTGFHYDQSYVYCSPKTRKCECGLKERGKRKQFRRKKTADGNCVPCSFFVKLL